MAIGRRLRARLTREVRVWGLRAPATVEASDGRLQIDVEDPADHDAVEGFGVAATAMMAMDLERRTWSGRLGEVLGDVEIGRRTAGQLDAFVRILGFRRDAEQDFKRGMSAADKRRCEDYARGVNAWIDTRRWEPNPTWKELGTQPRLWGAADCRLLQRAPARVDGAGTSISIDPNAPRGESMATIAELWALLGEAALRGPGAIAGGASLVPTGHAGIPSRLGGAPPDEVHAVITPLTRERARRLRSKVGDIDLRGPSPRRLTVRFGPEGGVVSDLFEGPPEYLWQWAPGAGRGGDPKQVPPLVASWSVPELTPIPVPRIRLVPLEGGA